MPDPILLTDNYLKGQLARNVPGAYYHERKWLLDAEGISPRTAAVTLRLFPELSIEHPELAALRDDLLEDVRPFDFATPYGVKAEGARVREASGFVPHPFQAIDCGYATAVIDAHGGAYMGWEPGLGKTFGSCLVMDDWDSNFNLIVCPNAVKESVWREDLAKHVPWIETVVLRNGKKQREYDLDLVAERMAAGEPTNFVVHYEALVLIAGKQKVKRVSGGKKWEPVDIHYLPEDGEKVKLLIGDGWNRFGTWDLVICDEGHRLKSPDAQMTRALKKIPTVGKLLLSGSIIENHLEELWSPLQWLYPKKYSAKWRTWNDKYLDYVDGPFGKVCLGVQENKVDDLRNEIGRFMVYRRATDELEIPTPHERDLLVDLSPGQRRIYDDLVDTLSAELADGTVLRVEEGLPLLSKLRQVATGLDLLGAVADSTKLDLAESLVNDDEDGVFVIFGWYKATLNALAKRLGEEQCWVVHGDKTKKHRDDAIRCFRAGERRVMLATIATLSEGVNLQRASAVIMLDRDWNPKKNEQAVDRVVRQGQTKHVAVTNIIARDTVDELKVNPTIANKEALSRLILGGR